MPYVPHTSEDIKAMLEVIGTESVDDLFALLGRGPPIHNHSARKT